MLNKLARLIASISLIIFIVNVTGDGQFYDNAQVIAEVSFLSWLIMVSLSCAMLIILSCMFYLSILVVGKRLPAFVSFQYTAMNNFFNTLLPLKGGVVIRGVYLKSQFSIKWLDYIIVTLFTQGFNVFFLLVVAIFLIPVGLFERLDIQNINIGISNFYLLFAFIVSVTFIIILFRVKILSFLESFIEGGVCWFHNPKILIYYLFSMFAFHILSSLRFWLSFIFAGSSISYVECLCIYCIVSAGLSFAITPGNIGIRESVIVLIASIFLIDAEIALTASIIDRLVGIFITLSLGGAATYLVSKNIDRKIV